MTSILSPGDGSKKLEYRKIGATALEVSVLGFGLGTISTEGWGKIDEAESLTLLREARDLGITFFELIFERLPFFSFN